MATETEIKLRLSEEKWGDVARVLSASGYRPGGRILEADQLWDRNGELRSSRRLLRLRRRGSETILTYKGPPVPGPHKCREEIEALATGEFERVLRALGYRPTFRYEKYRTTYRAEGECGIVTLDETPIGRFLELEGEADWIDRTAALLGYTRGDYVTASYLSLYQDYAKSNPGVPPDMTF